MTAAATLPAAFTLIDPRKAFADEFNAALDEIEVAHIPAVVYPERDFSGFTL